MRIALRIDTNPGKPSLTIYKDKGFGFSESNELPIIIKARMRNRFIPMGKHKTPTATEFNRNGNAAKQLYALMIKYVSPLHFKEPRGGSSASLIEISGDNSEKALNEIRQFFESNNITAHV